MGDIIEDEFNSNIFMRGYIIYHIYVCVYTYDYGEHEMKWLEFLMVVLKTLLVAMCSIGVFVMIVFIISIFYPEGVMDALELFKLLK